jgi:hypothetical protein
MLLAVTLGEERRLGMAYAWRNAQRGAASHEARHARLYLDDLIFNVYVAAS